MKQSFLGWLYDKKQSKIDIRTYVNPGDAQVHPDEFSKEGLSVPEIVMEHGSSRAGIFGTAPVLPVLLGTVIKAIKSYKSLKKNPPDEKSKATPEFLASLIDHAKTLGCHDVGFARLEPWMVFRDRLVLFPNTIVLTMEMRHDPILAERAGLGVVGANGLLISPGVGPSQRIATVYTNIENLPFATSNSHEWIREYCRSCGICIAACPGGAIFKQPRIDSPVGMTHIDFKKCAVPFANDHACTVCVKECVFFTTDYEALRTGVAVSQ